MRFLCILLIGLFALSTAGSAQSLRLNPNRAPQGGLAIPKSPSVKRKAPAIIPIPQVCPRGTVGTWPACISIKAKKCPESTTGKWPNCRAIAKSCPKGTVGKWPNCADIAKPTSKSCPEGQVLKGKSCVELTRGESDKPPPPTKKAKAPEPIPPTVAALTTGRPHRPEEILVLVDAARAEEIAARLARQYDVTAEPSVPLALLDGAIVRLKLKQGQSLESLLAALSADPDVDLAQPNYDYQVSEGPELPQNVPQYAGRAIRLEEAHRLARGQGVTIAVIDTAIETTHPELAGSIAGVFDAGGETPCQPEAHGTGIAGILVSHAKLEGVAPESKFLGVCAFRAASKTGTAQSTSLQLLKGIDWAFDAGAKIMNMSFTGPPDPLIARIVKAASEKGAIFVAAAGNEGPKAPPVYPAAYPEVLAVTAIDDKDRVYSKANRGDYISIGAPGVDIIVPALKDTYALSSGTSMAAAHVSGVVALLLEHDAALSTAEILTILASSARKPDASLGKDVIGVGVVDAAGAVSHREVETSGVTAPGDGSAAP